MGSSRSAPENATEEAPADVTDTGRHVEPTPPSAGNPPDGLAFLDNNTDTAETTPPARDARKEPSGAADTSSLELASRGVRFLKTYCYRCHGVDFEVRGFDILKPAILLAPPPDGARRERAYLVPSHPEESYIWQRAGVDLDMPPFGEEPAPTDEDLAAFQEWIEAGAPFPDDSVDEGPRPFVALKDVLGSIRDDLTRSAVEDRPFRRYFSLTALHNNREVSSADLRLYRAALSKLLNSLSWQRRITLPEAIDAQQTVFAIDLRDLGWSTDLWDEVVRGMPARSNSGASRPYPYGMSFDTSRDAEQRQIAQDVARLSEPTIPFLRVDWFVANASRPPLYEAILELPEELVDLEKRLDVDVEENFRLDRLVRAGFASSGISGHNRLVERHDAAFGAYWKSYDFANDTGRSLLTRFPLGPNFNDNPFEPQAFEQAGGEIIFNLPNGLQGYMLVNAKDEALAIAPTEIVSDRLRVAGTPAVVNGLSCMACHDDGMRRDFVDEVRAGNSLAGEAGIKVDRLFPTRATMDRFLDEDNERFLKALKASTGPFLQVGAASDKAIESFDEPIGSLARRHLLQDMDLADVAAELFLDDPEDLRVMIRSNSELRRLGLGPLVEKGGRIKRDAWESLQFFNSPYQEAALQIGLGSPYREVAPVE